LGLGLAIADRIAHLLAAPLTLRSTPGRGTVFALTLPVAAPAMPLQASAAASDGSGLDGLRVLIVDNDPQALQALHALLDGWRCRVAAVADGDAAVACLDAGEGGDLWLFDYHLDDGDTGTALRARLAERFGARPTLILSADDSGDVRRIALEHGLGLLPKPVKALALKSILRRLLTARAA
jgi:CheY-like chemotaxis protein